MRSADFCAWQKGSKVQILGPLVQKTNGLKADF